MLVKRYWYSLLALLCFATPALSAEAPPLRVVASFSILADLTANVGGADVRLRALVGPDADAHVYEPTPADARALAEADLVIVNGLGFEGWMERLIRASGYRGPVLVASAGIEPRRVDGETDPHAWQDLANTRRYVNNIATALAERDPARAERYRARAEQYLTELAALEDWVRQALAGIPTPARRVITSHDAFAYFGAAYGVEFLAPVSWNTEAEPTAADVAALIREIRERGVQAIFVENISDPRLVRQIAREAGATVGGTLYSDALSAPGTPAATYVGLFRYNVEALAGALAPAR